MKKKDIYEAEFFHYEERTVSFSELTRVSGLSAEILEELIEFGVVEPEEGEGPGSWIFSSYATTVARKALKLKVDFDLLPAGIAIALTYQQRIRELEKRVKELECQLMK
jgi:chaperone modulatory protein CbpM